jgi:lipopolysaccharide/colanic/teichoic acid biosynthesis glycosyltransferase
MPKRLLDICLSSLTLAVSAPVSLIIVMAIKPEDNGPVFYRQERWCWKGLKVGTLKFRTMVPHSDRLCGIRPAEENHPRIIRVGRVLRNMGQDELPQIVNILLGDMSFVGPRSLAVGEIIRREDGKVLL